MKLFIDDERHPQRGNWHVVRNVHDALSYLRIFGLPYEIHFDHDLGAGGEAHEIVTGMINMVLDNEIEYRPFDFYIHSQNPVGRDNIRGKIESFQKFMDGQNEV